MKLCFVRMQYEMRHHILVTTLILFAPTFDSKLARQSFKTAVDVAAPPHKHSANDCSVRQFTSSAFTHQIDEVLERAESRDQSAETREQR